MSDYYNILFDKRTIINTLFIDIKSALQYPTLANLGEGNLELYKRWCEIAKISYDDNLDTEATYKLKAINYPEFSKIIGISQAIVYFENNELKREFSRHIESDESLLIDKFFDQLSFISKSSLEKTVANFPYICGYNVAKFQIPLLMKRYFINRDNIIRNKQIPPILKKIITSKPWDLDLLDIQEIWKFGGYGNTPISLLSDSANLKRKGSLLSNAEISELYWGDGDAEKTIKAIAYQSANEININIQLMNALSTM